MDTREMYERVRQGLAASLETTTDPAPQWLRPSRIAAAAVLGVGFVGLLLVPAPEAVWFSLITLGALATLVLRLLSLRWATSLSATSLTATSLTATATGSSPRVAKSAVQGSGSADLGAGT
jgi:uncharacterized membrane protein YhiD involved in acid resistance